MTVLTRATRATHARRPRAGPSARSGPRTADVAAPRWLLPQVVTSRLRNLDEMRELATPECAALALRGGRWVPLSSTELLPGDVVALSRAPGGGVSYTYGGVGAEIEATCPG